MSPASLSSLSLAVAVALSVAVLPMPAAAGGAQTGQVNKLQTRARDSLMYFFLTATATDGPACATQPTG